VLKLKINPSPIFRRFLVSYILILVIPMLTGSISYLVSADIIKAKSIETSEMLLSQTKDVLDRRMREVENFTRQLFLDQDLNYLLNEQPDDGKFNVYAVWKSWQNTYAYGLTNNFLEDFYIYINNYDAVFTPSGVFVRPGDYYDLYHYENIGRDRWKQDILGKVHQRETLPLRPYSSDSKRTNVITYLQSLPRDGFRRPLGTVAVLIDESTLAKMLESIPKQYGGWAYISDKEGNTIARAGIGNSRIRELNLQALSAGYGSGSLTRTAVRDDTLLVSTKSDYNGWVYTIGLPKKVVMKQSGVIANVTLAVTASTLLFGLVAALLFAYRNSVPISRIVAAFREQAGVSGIKEKNEYDFLQGNISQLLASRKSLEEELKRQLPLLEDAFVTRLLRGEFDSVQEMRTLLHSQPDMVQHGEFGYAAVVRINGYSDLVSEDIIRELQAARILVKQLMKELAGTIRLSLTDWESDKIAVLISLSEGEEDEAEERIAFLFQKLRDQGKAMYRMQLTVGIGGGYRTLLDSSRSFEEAREALAYSILLGDQGAIWYHNVTKESNLYYYPIDLELRILNAVKIGELQEAERILDQLFEQNFAERKLSADMVQQLFGELKGTLLKLMQHSPFAERDVIEEVKRRVEQLPVSTSLERFRSDFRSLLETFCHLVLKKKESDKDEIVDKIKAILEKRYPDPDLNLYRIAEAVELPEKYVSQVFKEQTGENLSDFLEQIRIKHATDLLFTSEKTIDEIAQDVGYNSAHAFRRAFKRVSGVLPSLYRKTVN
jgi:YesN/AraC family two-component response regulator